MSVVDFTLAKECKYGIDNIEAVYLAGTRVWPPSHFSLRTGSPSDNLNQVLTLHVGDTFTVNGPTSGGDMASWIDGSYAMFRLTGGKWEAFEQNAPKSGFVVGSVALDSKAVRTPVKQHRDSFTVDTSGMTPGDYVISTGDYNDFAKGYSGLHTTIHLLPPFLPEDIVIQLPDAPYVVGRAVQNVKISAGQKITLKFPKSPLSQDFQDRWMWRHLCFIGWNAHTNAPLDMLNLAAVTDSEVISQYSTLQFVNGSATAPSGQFAQTDMYNKNDHIITATAAAYPGFWLVPVNGNFGQSYDLRKDSVIYFDMT